MSKTIKTGNRIKVLLISAGLFITVICQAQVYSDFDKDVDFEQYQTYAVKGWEKNSDQILNDLDKGRIEAAYKNELNSRGITQDDNNPDLSITLYVHVDEKTGTNAYTTFNGGMGYHPRWGWGGGMGGTATTSVSHYEYKQGTLVMDFYDSKTKKLVWQGTLKTTVSDDGKKREKTIPKNIKKLMKKFPVDPK